MNTAENWDDSWTRYPQMPSRRKALRRIQETILGTAAPDPLPRKTETHEPADMKAQGQPAGGQQPPDLDDVPTLSIPKTVKQASPAGQAEQAEADAGGARAQRRANPAIIACCALLAAAAITGTAIGARYCISRKAYNSAINSCVQAKQEVESAYRTPYAETYRTALSIETGQVKDPKTIQRLHALAGNGESPAPLLVCKAGVGKDALNGRADRMRETAANRTRLNSRMAGAAKTVLASRDAKSLDDARAALNAKKDEAAKLLGDSDGKVADNALRDSLQQAISQAGSIKGDKAKAYQDAAGALQSAIDQVNTSIQQKSQAGQAAPPAAPAQAAPAPAARQPAQQRPAPSHGSSRAPARHPTGGTGRPASPQTSRPTAPSAPQGGWSVPPSSGDDNSLPDHL